MTDDEQLELLAEGRFGAFVRGALAAGALAAGGLARGEDQYGGFGYNGDGYAYRGGNAPTRQQYDELKANRPFSVHRYNQRGTDTRNRILGLGLDDHSTQYGGYGFTVNDHTGDFRAARAAGGVSKVSDLETGHSEEELNDIFQNGTEQVEFEPLEINAKRSGLLKVRVFSSDGLNHNTEIRETTPAGTEGYRSFDMFLPVGCRGATPKEIESNQWIYKGGRLLTQDDIKGMFGVAFTAVNAKPEQIAPGITMLRMNSWADEEVKRNMLQLDREFTKVSNRFNLGYEGMSESVNRQLHGSDGRRSVTLGMNHMEDNGTSGHRMYGMQRYGHIQVVMRDEGGNPIPLPELRSTIAHELCHHMRLGHGKDFMWMLKRVIAYCESQGMEISYGEDDITPYDSYTLERGEDDPHESKGYAFWEMFMPYRKDLRLV